MEIFAEIQEYSKVYKRQLNLKKCRIQQKTWGSQKSCKKSEKVQISPEIQEGSKVSIKQLSVKKRSFDSKTRGASNLILNKNIWKSGISTEIQECLNISKNNKKNDKVYKLSAENKGSLKVREKQRKLETVLIYAEIKGSEDLL